MTRWITLGLVCFAAVIAAGAVIALATAFGAWLGTKIGARR